MIHSFKAIDTKANLNISIELEKNKSVYCFIGENGSGKTHLLETLASSFLYAHSIFTKDTELYNNWYLNDSIKSQIDNLKIVLPLGIEINGSNIAGKLVLIILLCLLEQRTEDLLKT